MAERLAFVCLGTGSGEHGAVHVRAWEVPADDEAMDQFAETLTEAFGKPAEWVSDEVSDGRLSMLFYEGGGRQLLARTMSVGTPAAFCPRGPRPLCLRALPPGAGGRGHVHAPEGLDRQLSPLAVRATAPEGRSGPESY